MATRNQYQKTVPFLMFVLALILIFLLVRPMITIILSGILLAYLAYPLYQRISKRVTNKSVSIFFALSIIILIILVPFSFLAFEFTKQGYYFYDSLTTKITKGALFGYSCTSADSQVCALMNRAEAFSAQRLSKFGFDKQLQNLIPVVEARITAFILSIPLILAQVFLTIIIAYFVLKDWRSLLTAAMGVLPMRKKTIDRLIGEFGDIAYTVIYAQLFVAIVQGIIGTIGFYLFGVPFPIILGVLLAFCALIPTIGTAIIWVPASLFLILSGAFSHEYWVLVKGIALFFYGLLIISVIDNILLAKIVHAKTKVNQIVVIVGVIGGASMFGVAGIFIGPILLPLLLTYFETFKERYA